MTIFIVSGFLFIPFWTFISRLWGKRKAYIMSLTVAFVGYSLMALPGENQFVLAAVVTALSGMSGIFLTTSNFLYLSLQGDVVDYDEFKTGLRREAIYANSMQFFNWYLSAFSTSTPFIIMAGLGFNADATQTVRTYLFH
jgi:GPH family glycoside/pentoside/hexuronide:cation symporter